jgi:uncharacterized protein involved in exopolysaccharide biosynthesis
LWRHKWKATFFCTTIVALSVVLAICWPRTYSSTVKLLVRPGRENLALDPTATTGQTMNLNRSEQVAVNCVLEVLDSRALAEKVVDRLGSKVILEGSEAANATGDAPESNAFVATAMAWYTTLRESIDQITAPVTSLDPVNEHEAASIKLQEMVNSRSAPFSNVVTMSCRAPTPQDAQVITAKMTDVFLEQYVDIHRTEGSHAFFVGQSETFQKKLTAAVDELRQEKDRFGLVSLDGHRAMLETQMGGVKGRLLDIDAKAAATTSEIESLTETLAKIQPKIVTQTVDGFGHSATDGMRQQLYDLEIKELEFLSKYTETSPFVTAIRKQRDDVNKILKSQPTDRTQTTEAINPIHQVLSQQKLQLQTTATSLQGEKYELLDQEARLQQRLRDFNEHEAKVRRLERDVDLLESQYRAHAASEEQARIDRALALNRISSVNVLQPATLEAKPVTPNKKLVVLVGLFLGVVGGVALALLADYADRTVKSEADVESHLALPVLLTLPRSSIHSRVMR